MDVHKAERVAELINEMKAWLRLKRDLTDNRDHYKIDSWDKLVSIAESYNVLSLLQPIDEVKESMIKFADTEVNKLAEQLLDE